MKWFQEVLTLSLAAIGPERATTLLPLPTLATDVPYGQSPLVATEPVNFSA